MCGVVTMPQSQSGVVTVLHSSLLVVIMYPTPTGCVGCHAEV